MSLGSWLAGLAVWKKTVGLLLIAGAGTGAGVLLSERYQWFTTGTGPGEEAIAPPARPAAEDPCAGVFDASAMDGTWRVTSGNARVGGSPMTGGPDEMVFRAEGNDLVMSIPGGPPVTLSPLAAGAPRWEWDKSKDRPLDDEEMERELDCRFDAITRYQGSIDFASDGDGTPSAATFSLLVTSRNTGVLLWTLTQPRPGQGYFQIARR